MDISLFQPSCTYFHSYLNFRLFRVEVPCLSYLFRTMGGMNGGNKFKLDAGDHQVPFAFPIPPHVPSAFGGKFGYIYYCCKAVVCGAMH